MNPPKIKISLRSLDRAPCRTYLNIVMERYGKRGKFDPLALIKETRGEMNVKDLTWLLIHCRVCRTPGMLLYYKTLGPDYGYIQLMMVEQKAFRTPEMLRYYKSLGPRYTDVALLIIQCKNYQTLEMLKYFMSLNPAEDDIRYLKYYCRYCRTRRARKILEGGKNDEN